MLNKILEYYYANPSRMETIGTELHRDQEYQAVCKLVSDWETKLEQRLTREEWKEFMEVSNTQGKGNLIAAEKNFAAGFREGALLMLEVLREEVRH